MSKLDLEMITVVKMEAGNYFIIRHMRDWNGKGRGWGQCSIYIIMWVYKRVYSDNLVYILEAYWFTWF